MRGIYQLRAAQRTTICGRSLRDLPCARSISGSRHSCCAAAAQSCGSSRRQDDGSRAPAGLLGGLGLAVAQKGEPVALELIRAIERGVTVNGLAIFNEKPELGLYYAAHPIGGPGGLRPDRRVLPRTSQAVRDPAT